QKNLRSVPRTDGGVEESSRVSRAERPDCQRTRVRATETSPGDSQMPILNINGRNMSVDAPGDTPLLWALRDHLGLTGTKFGCGIAFCGACTVHVDGKPVRSCSFALSGVVGHAITTIEGIGA